MGTEMEMHVGVEPDVDMHRGIGVHLQLAAIGQSQEQEIQLGLRLSEGAQGLGPSFAIFPDLLTDSGLEAEQSGLKPAANAMPALQVASLTPSEVKFKEK